MGELALNKNTLIPIEAGGIWIECCYRGCRKWRYSPDYQDPVDVPEKWYCYMNSENAVNTCAAPESDAIDEHDVFVFSKYKAGSIVWAKVVGHPWIPAMVNFCPDWESYYWFDDDSDIPTQYHVTFFEKQKVTRAWIKNAFIKPFVGNEDPTFALKARVRGKKLSAKKRKEILDACKIARDASHLSLARRLKKYHPEMWKIARRTHNLVQTPGIVKKPTPPIYAPKRQREAAKFNDVGRHSDVNLTKKNLLPELESLPPQDKIRPDKVVDQKKIIPNDDDASKKKERAFAVPIKHDGHHSDSSMIDTTLSVSEKESPDLDDTRSIDSVFPDTQAVQQHKQMVEIKVGNGPMVKIVGEEILPAAKISEIVEETIGEVIPSSQNSTPSKISCSIRVGGNGEVDESNEGTTPDRAEEFEAILNSPNSWTSSKLSLKLKLMNEERLRNYRVMKTKMNSENLQGIDQRKENKPEESRYLRALSEFTATENNNKQNYRLPSRSLHTRKPLPEWLADRKKRTEVLAERANKLMSKLLDDKDSKMYKENRENFIAEQQQKATAGPSNSRDPRLNNINRDFWKIEKSMEELITSDDDSV